MANPLDRRADTYRRRIDFRIANPTAPESAVPAAPPISIPPPSANALERMRGPRTNGFTIFTDGPQTQAQRDFGNPESRFRIINEPGLTREERMRRRGIFMDRDEAAADRAGTLAVAQEGTRAKLGEAGILAQGSIVGSILGGGNKAGRGGGTGEQGNPLDSIKLARELGFRNPFEISQDQRAQADAARKNVLDLLGRDYGEIYGPAPVAPGQIAPAKPQPTSIDDYIRNTYTGGTGARAPLPRMETILDDLNAQHQAAYGKPYFTRPTQPAQGMGDLKADPNATPQGRTAPAATSAPVQPAPQGAANSQPAAQDRNAQARAWAEANPNDPRSAAILRKLGAAS